MQNTASRATPAPETEERLIRLRASRRIRTVELRVHYEVRRENGCDFYRIITIDEVG